MITDFTEMEIWQEANSIAEKVFLLTSSLPKSEDYALTSQMRRAAVSISGNIAEGFGRGHIKDKINFYYFSRASAFELKSHLLYGCGVKYFDDENVENKINEINKVIEGINKLIKALKSKS